MQEPQLKNRDLWDAWAEGHARTAFYDVDAFRRGVTTLKPVELEALGDVRGRSLLHLQCHFGLDTLSWARQGAMVTGVDFSLRAIEIARGLAEDCGIEARFVCSTVEALPAVLDERFDIVFTSYGVLPWLPDLGPWARTIARMLRPGGVFLLVEFHPLLDTLADPEPRFEFPYFPGKGPVVAELTGSYGGAVTSPMQEHTWPHTIGEVVTALAQAGLHIQELREFDYCVYDLRAYFEQREPGKYWVRLGDVDLPLMFSVRASI